VDGDDRAQDRQVAPERRRGVAAQQREQRDLHDRVRDQRQLLEEVRFQHRSRRVGDRPEPEHDRERDQHRADAPLHRGQRRRIGRLARQLREPQQEPEPDRDRAVERQGAPQHHTQRDPEPGVVTRLGEHEHQPDRDHEHDVRRDHGHDEPAPAPDVTGGVQARQPEQCDLDRRVRHEHRLAEEVLRQPEHRSEHVDGSGCEQHPRHHPQPHRQSPFGALPRVLPGGRLRHRSLRLHH
jgi:hypothetical protein